MWNTNPQEMCRSHLLGEHREMHALVGIVRRKTSLDGYIENKLIATSGIKKRHDELVVEMKRRGYNHKSPLRYRDKINVGEVDEEANRKELARRCQECRAMQA